MWWCYIIQPHHSKETSHICICNISDNLGKACIARKRMINQTNRNHLVLKFSDTLHWVNDIPEGLLSCCPDHFFKNVWISVEQLKIMLWISLILFQCSYSSLSFLKVLWPEFSVWDFYGAILSFQWNYEAFKVKETSVINHILFSSSQAYSRNTSLGVPVFFWTSWYFLIIFHPNMI